MNLKRYSLIAFVCAVGLAANVTAAEMRDYARVAFVLPGASHNPLRRDEYVAIVVEGPYLSYDKCAILAADETAFIDRLIKAKSVSYVALYTREGSKYGDLVRAIDLVRGTAAKQIGISMKKLNLGQEP